ncbi:MAG: hypothetical protein AAB588_05070 [Patescibacteria group bacterium]
MPSTTGLQLEDLILSSRSLTLEEKQDLLKRLDTLDEDKKTKLREVLERELQSFQKMDQIALRALQEFTQDLRPLTQALQI